MKLKAHGFPFILWYFTNGDENLFDLDKDALKTYILLVEAAQGWWGHE